jgi:hypothetical protein
LIILPFTSLQIDDKVIEGRIKEKEKAKQTYDDAIASGHGIFSVSLFSIHA